MCQFYTQKNTLERFSSNYVALVSTYLSVGTWYSQLLTHWCSSSSVQFTSNHIRLCLCRLLDEPFLIWHALVPSFRCFQFSSFMGFSPNMYQVHRSHGPNKIYPCQQVSHQSSKYRECLIVLPFRTFKSPSWHSWISNTWWWDNQQGFFLVCDANTNKYKQLSDQQVVRSNSSNLNILPANNDLFSKL
jgi:hypothetical protein